MRMLSLKAIKITFFIGFVILIILTIFANQIDHWYSTQIVSEFDKIPLINLARFMEKTKTKKSVNFPKFQILQSVVREPNCLQLFKGNVDQRQVKYHNYWNNLRSLSDDDLLRRIEENCDSFLTDQEYLIKIPKHEEENDFPIAFTIIAFKSAAQVERLIRTIYRPWNYYCIHVDKKASAVFMATIRALTGCLNKKFGNFITTDKLEMVRWGHMSLLKADLNCMKDIYYKYKDWKYLINLTGQEFPLKTNLELVKILKAFNGANNVFGTFNERHEDRLPEIKVPFPLTWFKGEIHITVNRDFVKFIFESYQANFVIEAIRNRWIPDETLYPTLNFNPQLNIPGSYIGNPDDLGNSNETRKYFLTRYKNWGQLPCKSKKIVRDICIWGVADISTLIEVPHLFANKFYEEFQPATLRCLEVWYYNKTYTELVTGDAPVNASFYSSLYFVVHQYKKPTD